MLPCASCDAWQGVHRSNECHMLLCAVPLACGLQVATGLAAAGHADPRFWAAMEATSERRLLSFSGHHLAQLMVAVGESARSLFWAPPGAAHGGSG